MDKKTLRIEFFDQANRLVPTYTWSSFRDKISLSNQDYLDLSTCTNIRVMLIDEHWMIEDTISFGKDNEIDEAVFDIVTQSMRLIILADDEKMFYTLKDIQEKTNRERQIRFAIDNSKDKSEEDNNDGN